MSPTQGTGRVDRTVVDIAAAVANGSLSAVAVLEENLAAIAARESEVHAFNLVTADRARERATQIDADVQAGKKVGRLAGVDGQERSARNHHGEIVCVGSLRQSRQYGRAGDGRLRTERRI